MNPAARFLLLAGAFVLLVFGIVCLKQRLGTEPIPPAFISADGSGPGGYSAERGGNQPTILSAEPSPLHDVDAHSPVREFRPVPLEGEPRPADYPVNTISPTYPRVDGSFPATDRSNTKSAGEAIPTDAASLRMTPAKHVSTAWSAETGGPTPDSGLRASVTTADTDSFWTISERVYGRGDYYRALFLLNRERIPAPDRIPAGIVLVTPPIAELRRLFPEACPKLDPLPGTDG